MAGSASTLLVLLVLVLVDGTVERATEPIMLPPAAHRAVLVTEITSMKFEARAVFLLKNAASSVVEGRAELVVGVDRVGIWVERCLLLVRSLLCGTTGSRQEAGAGGGLAALLLLRPVGTG